MSERRQRERSATVYDFVHPGHRLATEWPVLGQLHQRLVEGFSRRLAERFRMRLEAYAEPTRRMRYEDFVADLPAGTVVNEIALAPEPGVLLFCLETAVVPALVDGWFGGTPIYRGEPPALPEEEAVVIEGEEGEGDGVEDAGAKSDGEGEDDELSTRDRSPPPLVIASATERRALGHVLDALTAALGESWADIAELGPSVGRATTPERLARGGYGDVVIDCGLQIRLGQEIMSARLVYPRRAAGAVRGEARPGGPHPSGRGRSLSPVARCGSDGLRARGARRARGEPHHLARPDGDETGRLHPAQGHAERLVPHRQHAPVRRPRGQHERTGIGQPLALASSQTALNTMTQENTAENLHPATDDGGIAGSGEPSTAAGATTESDAEPRSVPAQARVPAAGGAASIADIAMIGNIPVNLSMEIGRTSLTISELMSLGKGSVVELQRMADEPLDVLVNGTLVAHGEAVVVGDRFGIRLTDVVSQDERLGRLG